MLWTRIWYMNLHVLLYIEKYTFFNLKQGSNGNFASFLLYIQKHAFFNLENKSRWKFLRNKNHVKLTCKLNLLQNLHPHFFLAQLLWSRKSNSRSQKNENIPITTNLNKFRHIIEFNSDCCSSWLKKKGQLKKNFHIFS